MKPNYQSLTPEENSFFFEACKTGNLDKVREIIDINKINIQDKNTGSTGLIYAAENNHLEVVQFFCSKDFREKIDFYIFRNAAELGEYEYPLNALASACLKSKNGSHSEVVKTLLKATRWSALESYGMVVNHDKKIQLIVNVEVVLQSTKKYAEKEATGFKLKTPKYKKQNHLDKANKLRGDFLLERANEIYWEIKPEHQQRFLNKLSKRFNFSDYEIQKITKPIGTTYSNFAANGILTGAVISTNDTQSLNNNAQTTGPNNNNSAPAQTASNNSQQPEDSLSNYSFGQ